jgi:Na+:H+ antiporter, NhaA family
MSKPRGPIDFIQAKVISPVKEFIHDSRAVGITLICCTFISLIVSNSPWSAQYVAFWDKEIIHLPVFISLPHSVLHIINDCLMAFFFFLVGLEIKRELMIGELNSVKKSMLPIIAALGGMVAPAVIYLLWCGHTQYSGGWGVPMATDIAFSLGVLSLLGKRAPLSLRIFLTALAIIDDLGGILTIAIFYAEKIDWNYLAFAAGIMAVLTLMNLMKVKKYYLYFIVGTLLWYVIYNSGVHATIAGVLLAITIPLHKIDKLEHHLHDPVNFLILPLFALANTAIVLPQEFGFIFSSLIHHGIFMGLVLGKPVGIFLFSMLAVRLGIAKLPNGMGWRQLWGMGMIAGIGFTMSIFMATLAFRLPGNQLVAKVAIMGASLVAGILGFLYLKRLNRKKMKEERMLRWAAERETDT